MCVLASIPPSTEVVQPQTSCNTCRPWLPGRLFDPVKEETMSSLVLRRGRSNKSCQFVDVLSGPLDNVGTHIRKKNMRSDAQAVS